MESRPRIRELNAHEVEEILTRNRVGRLAYASRSMVDIEPVNYVYADGWIYGRTSAGTKISSVSTNWWVAFEVDEANGLFEWASVVCHGGFYRLSNTGPEADRRRYDLAIEALRGLIPETFTDGDPVPYRTIVFGVLVQESRGKACSARHAEQPA